MSAAQQLQHIYAQRADAIRKLLAAGERLVGCYNSGAPIELILATGHTPVAIAPSPWRATPLAERYFDPGLDSMMRAAFESLVNGELARLSLALHVSHFEGDALLYYCCKEVLKRGEGQGLPPLHLHASLAENSDAAHDFSLGQMRLLASRLAAASGHKATDEALAQAVALTNRLRASGAELLARRRAGRVPAVEAFRVIGAGRFLAPQTHADLLDAYLHERRGAAVNPAPRVLLLSSAPLFVDDLHVAIDAAGAQVVAEDDTWGSRAFGPPLHLDGDPLLALSNYYRHNTPNRAIHPHDRRLQWIYEEAASPDIDAIMVHMPASDQSLGWDYPRLRNFFAAQGKPHVVFEDELLVAGGAARIAAVASSFLTGLARRA